MRKSHIAALAAIPAVITAVALGGSMIIDRTGFSPYDQRDADFTAQIISQHPGLCHKAPNISVEDVNLSERGHEGAFNFRVPHGSHVNPWYRLAPLTTVAGGCDINGRSASIRLTQKTINVFQLPRDKDLTDDDGPHRWSGAPAASASASSQYALN